MEPRSEAQNLITKEIGTPNYITEEVKKVGNSELEVRRVTSFSE